MGYWPFLIPKYSVNSCLFEILMLIHPEGLEFPWHTWQEKYNANKILNLIKFQKDEK